MSAYGACLDCAKPLARRNTSGRCRGCFWGMHNRDPARTAVRVAKLKITLAQPENMARVVRHCTEASRSRLAWCPLEYRDEYRRLTRSKTMPAREAREIIEGQMRRDEARYRETGLLQRTEVGR